MFIFMFDYYYYLHPHKTTWSTNSSCCSCFFEFFFLSIFFFEILAVACRAMCTHTCTSMILPCNRIIYLTKLIIFDWSGVECILFYTSTKCYVEFIYIYLFIYLSAISRIALLWQHICVEYKLTN